MTPYLNLKMLSKLSLLFIFSEIYLIITVKSSSQKFYESLTPALGLEKNASIQKITKYYEKLYLRLHSKDYGFAKFGESCEVSTVDEIEDHLDMGYGIIRDQEEDGKYRRAVEQHLHPKLREFYYRSKTFCDFRKLLICDSTTHECICAHPSLGVGRNETCQINIGKRCDLNSTQLIPVGIPSLPEHPITINCISQAECVSSFGVATKLCRCKKGYFGAGCKPSLQHTWPRKNMKQSGRGITGARSMSGNNKEMTEYFLYPEEIKLELVKLMNSRGLYEPETRELEAEDLYSKMEADSDKEKMVIRDIFLRRLATLKHGEKCDSEKQLYLDNPPLAKDSFTWVDPKPKDVQQWQLYLLQDDKPICNYVQFLRCDEKNMLCRCKKGLVYESNHCRLKLGKTCDIDYDGVYEFDPLQDRKRFTPPFSPACVSGAECKAMPLFFMKQCWCPEGKICGNSSSTSTFNPSTIKNLTSTIQKRFTLNLGESCDPEAHSVLLDPKDSEVRDYNLRVSTLQKLIVSRPSVHFCNLDKFLNCSSSKKCECFHQLVEQEGICRSRNLDQCESTFPYGTSLYPSGPQLWKIEQIFQKSFSPQCVKNAGCGNDKMIGKCVCKNGKAGPLCKDPKSVFASVLNPSHIQGYNEDGKINKVFYNLNFFTYKMEELMTLTYGDECNPKFGFMVERIQSFYRDIGSSEDIAKGKTLYQYKKATKWVEYLLKSGVTELCNQFHGLSCHPISKKCYCPSTHEYEDKICKLRPNEECDPNPQASWISVCRKNSHCLPATSTTKSSCQCLEGWSGPDCQTPSRNNGRHTGVETCENNVTMNLNGVIISECLDGLVEFEDNIPLPPEPNLFSDFATMLDRILNHRNLPMDSKCDPDQETQFTKLFPTLPHFKQDDYESLPQGKLLTYSELRRIERNVGAKFCDRKKYLVCNGESGRCDCNLNVYVKEGLKCRLREGKFCGEIGTVYERGVELPLCEKGTKCRKLGFGVHTCVHVATEDEVF